MVTNAELLLLAKVCEFQLVPARDGLPFTARVGIDAGSLGQVITMDRSALHPGCDTTVRAWRSTSENEKIIGNAEFLFEGSV